ncbi:MAG TPA: hypothetical protein VFG81_02670 [Anaerolineales bacterium]|jgi:hypothetical protein|nr:hypothetical protein [Anaerolineales bacterium]
MNKNIWTSFIVAVVFGLIVLTIVLASFTIPIPGTGVVTDPREIFVTIGSALTGPFGALIIGLFAGIMEPGGIPLASLLGHIAGGLWMAFAYKRLVYDRMPMPIRLAGWVVLVIIYYYVFVIPGFVIGLTAFYGEKDAIGLFVALAKGVIVEISITTIVTTLVLLALPPKYHRPLW